MSSRTLSSGVQAALASAQCSAVVFVELDFASGDLRLTTAGHDLYWNGYTWIGVGLLGEVGPIAEQTTLQATGVKLTLSGVDTSIIAIALQEHYQGRAANIWLAFIDTSSGAIIADPIQLGPYKMDVMQLQDGETATVVLQVESDFASWDRPRVRRFTDADQKAEFSGDRGLEFVTEAASRTISWGAG